ncbi:hypothetical protein [Burkholderia gladioli]|uniref:hypothetical protein n=1 Tax=Burkholderia gladioli TaxID=28095 RepID=UPI00163E7812|nr:hypothetical protein [Burkholderia gladioli]
MNNIESLRQHLFDALAALNDRTKPADIERAKAVAELSQVIINSAKVEVEFIKAAGGKGTGFLTSPGTINHRLGG